MNVKMTQTGKFALDGMHVTTYQKGDILGDETQERVKSFFITMNQAEKVEAERKPIEEKIERPVIAPDETKVIKPEVKKKKGNKNR